MTIHIHMLKTTSGLFPGGFRFRFKSRTWILSCNAGHVDLSVLRRDGLLGRREGGLNQSSGLTVGPPWPDLVMRRTLQKKEWPVAVNQE